jgi:hypothetical protein
MLTLKGGSLGFKALLLCHVQIDELFILKGGSAACAYYLTCSVVASQVFPG